MTDYTGIIVGFFIVMGLCAVYLTFHIFGGENFLNEALGRKQRPIKDLGHQTCPRGTIISIAHPQKGTFKFNTRIKKPDGKFDLLGPTGEPVATFDRKTLKLTEGCIESLFTGKTRRYDFIVDDESASVQKDRTISALRMQIESLNKSLTDQAKSYAQLELQLAGNRRAVWDKENKDKHLYYIKQRGNNQPQVIQQTEQGGE